MKSLTTTLAFATVVVLLFCVSPSTAKAQAPDTMTITSTATAIDAIILGDTLANGNRVNPNRAYRLKHGLRYRYSSTINAHFPLTVIANDTTVGIKPPVIFPEIHADNSWPRTVFNCYKNATFKNLYMTHVRPDGITDAWDEAVAVSGDSTKTVMQGCVVEAFGAGIRSWAKFSSAIVRDNVFRNGSHPSSYFSGHVLFFNGGTIDTVIMQNNTSLNCGGYFFLVGNNGPQKFVLMEHNTIFTNYVNPMYMFNATQHTVRDNIFYGTLAMGQDSTEFAQGWYENDSLTSSTISLDTLDASWSFPEANRFVTVNNNDYFWPDSMVSKWKLCQDKVTPPVWMNSRTLSMFANKTTWPHLTAIDNYSVDPGFPQSMTKYIDSLMLKYVLPIRSIPSRNGDFFYEPSGNIVSTAWPLAENLAYSSIPLQTGGHDGYPVGDLNWFPTKKAQWIAAGLMGVEQKPEQVPTEFALSQNYPNPFNPATSIEYSIKTAGQVKLQVFNMLGQLVRTLADGQMNAGRFVATWDGKNEQGMPMASGVYFYRLQSHSFTSTMRMLMLK